MVISPDSRLVTEEDAPACDFSRLDDGRIFLFFPPADPLRILLISTHQGPLRRQAHVTENVPNGLRRGVHTELPLDKVTDHLPGPQREVELQLPRVFTYDPFPQLLPLLPGQARGTAGCLFHHQRSRPLFLVFLPPVVYG